MIRSLVTTLGIFLIVLIAWQVLLNKPLDRRIEISLGEIDLTEKKLTAYRVALHTIDRQMAEYRSLYDSYGLDSAAYTGHDEVVMLYRSLDSLCRQDGYDLIEITPSLMEVISFLRKWDSGQAVVEIPIRMRITGKYRALAQLVGQIERHDAFKHLTQCRVDGTDESYPDCLMDVAFVAGLTNRRGIITID